MVSRWERLSAFEGGAVACLASAEASDGTTHVFAATPVGVFRSADLGRNWAPLSETAPVSGAIVVAASPTFAEDGTLFIGGLGGLHRWRDARSVPELVLSGCRAQSLVCIANGRLLVGTEDDGIIQSYDGGRTWSGSNAGLLDLSVLAVACSPEFNRDGLAFAATPSGLYRTRNGAESWRLVDLGGDDVPVQCLAISSGPAGMRIVLAGTEDRGLLRSEDSGRTWRDVPDLTGSCVNAVALLADGAALVATDEGIWRSSDHGLSCRAVGEATEPLVCLAVVPGGTTASDAATELVVMILGGTPAKGVARSDDVGASWSLANDGLEASLVTGLWLSPSFGEDQTVFAANPRTGFWVSRDGARTWIAGNLGLEHSGVSQLVVSPCFRADGTLVATTSAGVCVTNDGGCSWRTAVPGDASAVTAASVDGATTFLAALEDGSLVYSRDSGVDWGQIASPAAGRTVTQLAIAHDGVIFVAAEGGGARAAGGADVLWRSTDWGKRWSGWLSDDEGGWPWIAVVPENPHGDSVLVALGDQVLRPLARVRESRGGNHRPVWSKADLPGDGITISGIAVAPDYARDRTAFVATNRGVFVSRDGGGIFESWNDGLTRLATVAVVPSPSYAEDRLVYALGLGGAVWRRADG